MSLSGDKGVAQFKKSVKMGDPNLQVRSRTDRCARARMCEGADFFSISSASNFRGGLPKESLRLDQSFQNNLMKTDFSCRAF